MDFRVYTSDVILSDNARIVFDFLLALPFLNAPNNEFSIVLTAQANQMPAIRGETQSFH